MLADPVLVLVDLQKDFCTPGFAHDPDPEPAPGSVRAAAENAGAFLERYRASGRTPVLVRTRHEEASMSPTWAAKYGGRETPCRAGTEGAEFIPKLDVRDSDAVVTKRRYSAFHGTALDTHLRSAGATELLIGGVLANVCVSSAVRGAFDRDYGVTTLADCTGAPDPDLRAATLETLDGTFGAVADSEDVDLPPVE